MLQPGQILLQPARIFFISMIVSFQDKILLDIGFHWDLRFTGHICLAQTAAVTFEPVVNLYIVGGHRPEMIEAFNLVVAGVA